MDRIAAIAGTATARGLRGHLDAALAQQASTGRQTVISVVVYDLPNRDCAALASNGELQVSQNGLARYKAEYVDPIAAILGDAKYRDLRIVTVVEPDSLPNLVTNLSNPKCAEAQSSGAYVQGIQYALDRLHPIPNVYTYLDVAHSGWLGWDSNFGPAVNLITQTIRGTVAGVNSVDGFITNTANYTPLDEPNLPDSGLTIGGQPIRSAKFYEWNPYFDEADYATALHACVRRRRDAGRHRHAHRHLAQRLGRRGTADRRERHDGRRLRRLRPHRPAPAPRQLVQPERRHRRAAAGRTARRASTRTCGSSRRVSPTARARSSRTTRARASTGCATRRTAAASRPTAATSPARMPDAPIAGRWFPQHFEVLVRNAYPAL